MDVLKAGKVDITTEQFFCQVFYFLTLKQSIFAELQLYHLNGDIS
jgi:hypothetical protein